METTLKKCEKQGYAACVCDRSIHFCFEHAKKHIKMPCGIHKLIILYKTSNQRSAKCKFVFEYKNETKSNPAHKSKHIRNAKSDQMFDEINKDKFSTKIINNMPEFFATSINSMHDKNYDKLNIIQKLKEDYDNIFKWPENVNRIGKPNAHLVDINKDRVSLMKNKLIAEYKIFLEGPKVPILCIELTSDSKYIALGSCDSTILIWNTWKNRQKAILHGHENSVLCLLITSDNKYIISGSIDRTIRIWDLLEKKQLNVLKGHYDSVSCLAVTTYYKYIVSGSNDGNILVWNS